MSHFVPPEKVLRTDPTLKKVGDISRTTLWRLQKYHGFPKPIQLTPGLNGYLESEIDAWLANRPRGE